jgi:hypothetical protein
MNDWRFYRWLIEYMGRIVVGAVTIGILSIIAPRMVEWVSTLCVLVVILWMFNPMFEVAWRERETRRRRRPE